MSTGISIHAPPRGATFHRHVMPPGAKFQFTPLREGRPANKRAGIQRVNFNSRPSARGDPFRGREVLFRRISIHAPPRGATFIKQFQSTGSGFQFTPLREGRPERRNRQHRRNNFNSRPSARGDGGAGRKSRHAKFQFTPLREGRPQRLAPTATTLYFNSRPSARGDVDAVQYEHSQDYFNSRPSARGDVRRTHNAGSPRLFQFTPLREGRLVYHGLGKAHGQISIHAPPRGATLTIDDISTASIFQFTPLREGRLWREDDVRSVMGFQFTPLREGRLEAKDAKEEGRQISIHAPPRGATWTESETMLDTDISIHAPPRGATSFRASFRHELAYFNSRPSARGDDGADACDSLQNHFNSRPSARGD